MKGNATMKSNIGLPEHMQHAGGIARGAATSQWMTMLARLGYAAKGVVYLIVGVLAVQLVAGRGGETTDRKGALHTIYEQPFGKFLLAMIAIGLVYFALWCFIQTVFDTEGKGKSTKGILARLGYSGTGISYTLLAVGAIQLVVGTGSGGQSSTSSAQSWTGKLLQSGPGVALIILVGLIVLGIAASMFYCAYSAHFQNKLALQELKAQTRKWILSFGRFGYAAVGVVFSIIGLFLIIVVFRYDSSDAKGLDSALQVLLQQPFGSVLLAIVALGLMAYGAYSLIEARYRRIAGRQFSFQ